MFIKKLAVSAIVVVLLAASAVSARAAGLAEGPVARYGRLFTDGNKIVGERSGGEAVQVKGVSFSWSSNGYPSLRFFREETVNAMVDGWKAEVIRVPLAVRNHVSTQTTGGYVTDPDSVWARVKRVVDAAIARDVYAIIDWHSHTAHNNPTEQALAIDFFTNPNFAGQYGNSPAVIFEIYNEPPGDVPWASVKNYADQVIAAIRAAGFNNLILVGNPQYSHAPFQAIDSPPVDPENNFAMSLHFYTGTTHLDSRPWFVTSGTNRSLLESVLAAGLPLFANEWGTNDGWTTSMEVNFPEADKWHAFLDEHKISSCAFHVGAYTEAPDFWPLYGSPFNFDINDLANWTNPARMNPNGRYVYRLLTGNDTTFTPEEDYPQFTGLRSRINIPPRNSWWAYGDDGSGGASTITLAIDEGTAQVEFSLVKGGNEYDPFAAVSFAANVAKCDYGIGYTYKGSTHRLHAEQSNIEDWDTHSNSKPVETVDDWTTLDIPWSYFTQQGGGAVVPRDHTLVNRLRWALQGPDGTSGNLWIKDVYCLGDETVSIKHSGSRSANVNSFVRVTGRSLQVRMPDNGKVGIYGLNGKRIRTIELTKGDHQIRMNGLPRGAYVVKAHSGAWKKSVRAIVR